MQLAGRGGHTDRDRRGLVVSASVRRGVALRVAQRRAGGGGKNHQPGEELRRQKREQIQMINVNNAQNLRSNRHAGDGGLLVCQPRSAVWGS